MALSIKDQETDRKAAEIAAATGETKTAAARQAVNEMHERFELEGRLGGEPEVWLRIPARPRARQTARW
jgi:hypothetical protein